MRRLDHFLVVAVLGFWTPGAMGQGWTDDTWPELFDTYAAGDLTPQSNWELWYGSGIEAEAKVRRSEKYSDPNSVAIINQNDVVWDFSLYPPPGGAMPSTGQWSISVKTKIASGVTGQGNFILLSRYDQANNNSHWAFQVTVDATANTITYDGSTGNKQTLALVRDHWVSLCVAVDFDTDRVDSFYGEQRLVDHASWLLGQGGTGSMQLQAIDLYGGTAQQGIKLGALFFDSLRVETALGTPLLVETTPNPVSEGGSIAVYTAAQDLPGAVGIAFITGLDDVPNPMWVEAFAFQLDGAGLNATKLQVPLGTLGHSFQGRVFAADLSRGPPYPLSLGNTFSIEVK